MDLLENIVLALIFLITKRDIIIMLYIYIYLLTPSYAIGFEFPSTFNRLWCTSRAQRGKMQCFLRRSAVQAKIQANPEFLETCSAQWKCNATPRSQSLKNGRSSARSVTNGRACIGKTDWRPACFRVKLMAMKRRKTKENFQLTQLRLAANSMLQAA